ncbi:hypothetical protein [Jatrophihabitans endophyticus]|uniref:hypothetical protein n=1 Tax=Jatrophihabitans endophyticus TaxID=1206085 RepID=UPI001A05ADDD|nr:hypothetical protein [Jatrophihabitans endophyticus]MBE7189845.1 hypothetical protein [Jatrophihabitans endophyticus]
MIAPIADQRHLAALEEELSRAARHSPTMAGLPQFQARLNSEGDICVAVRAPMMELDQLCALLIALPREEVLEAVGIRDSCVTFEVADTATWGGDSTSQRLITAAARTTAPGDDV